MLNNSKIVYEFLLWANCSNNCTFCHQRDILKHNILTDNEKSKSIKACLDYIKSENFVKGSHIMICGGELFDNPKDCKKLQYLFTNIAELVLSNHIDIIYLNTNLIYKDLSSLIKCLNILNKNNILSHVHFTTSFDLKGRFKSQEALELFDSNFKYIRNEFLDLNCITNIIMTNTTCQAILNKSFSLKSFSETYNTYINLIPYIKRVESLAATKKDIINTLKEADKQLPGYINAYKTNLQTDYIRYVFEYNKKEGLIDSTAEYNTCGHCINFTKVFEDNECFICELSKYFS